MKTTISLLACGALLAPFLAHAADAASAPPGGRPPGPPPEAIAACQGKSEGTQVSFTLRGGQSVSGVCQTSNGVLAARPAGGGPGGPAR